MVFVEVRGWDCCQYVSSTWVNQDLKDFDTKTLGNFDNDRRPEKIEQALKKAGFKKVQPRTVTFGGNF